MNSRNYNPTDDLAQGFGEHAASWATAAGAAETVAAIVRVAAERLSLATSEGHACLPLSSILKEFENKTIDELRDSLLASHVVATPGDATVQPMVLDGGNRLYLYRYFHLERRLAANLMARAAANMPLELEAVALRTMLAKLFAGNATNLGNKTDWQKIAVALAVRRRLTIISGAPGTGKTTTVLNLLACIIEGKPDARIAIAAPTGKAAQRMLDELRGERAAALPPKIRDSLPTESHTIHRLLGVTPGAARPRFHIGNPLPLDVLVVDEASMLDLALATRLVEALPLEARLILLGDKDQLAAVEVGSIFAELSADPTLTPPCLQQVSQATGTPSAQITPPAATQRTALADSVVWFTENYRISTDSGIGRLSAHVNSGDAEAAMQWMADGGSGNVRWIEENGPEPGAETMACVIEGYKDYANALRDNLKDKAAIFSAFERFRVLCAIRETPRGVSELNKRIRQHLLDALGEGIANPDREVWYPGRPVLILRNNYMLKLFNGDIGICLPDTQGHLSVWFAAEKNEFRSIAPNRLPEHNDAYATTVHKAQGSQFNSVLLVMPVQNSKPASRELLYTAVTRARGNVTISACADVLRTACANATQRHTGLIDQMLSVQESLENHKASA